VTRNIDALLRAAEHQLTGLVEGPRADAEILAQHTLGISRTMLRAFPERTTTTTAAGLFESAIARRAQGEPVAYILGEREFWSMRLKVTPATLIPRPETETLVEAALDIVPPNAEWRVADLGTGSGAIALAIARERPGCQITATDACSAALAVACENSTALEIGNVDFRLGHWTEPLHTEKFDLIVSNPPYIAADDDHLSRGDLLFEPKAALTPGQDGLTAIDQIVEGARQSLKENGWLALEHGWDQSAPVRALLNGYGFRGVVSIADLAGIARVTVGQFGGNITSD